MRWIVLVLVAVGALTGVVADIGAASGQSEAAPISGVRIPSGYRDWRLISVAHEEGSLNDLRAILGNDIAIEASRKGQLPFPDGAIIARLAWSYYDPLEESSKAFGRLLDEGIPADEAMQKTCFPCHETVKARDFVFNRYSP